MISSLLNTGRGPLINEAELAAWLDAHILRRDVA